MNPCLCILPRLLTRVASLATLALLALGPATGMRLAAGPSVGGDFSLLGTATGGGGQSVGGAYTLEATVGLPATGTSAGGNFVITGGLVGVYVVPGDVALTLTRTDNGQVRLDWPAKTEGYVLEFTAQVGADAVWTRVNPAPTGNTLSVPFDAPARFYRLRKP